MSASLVGSEMCIRDRLSAVWPSNTCSIDSPFGVGVRAGRCGEGLSLTKRNVANQGCKLVRLCKFSGHLQLCKSARRSLPSVSVVGQ
eukprot:14617060-Alexandrium_andersonii.AAC.1